MFESVKYSRLAEGGDGTDPTLEVLPSNGKAFSFDSAFKYDSGPTSSKYRQTANYNSAFKYSGNSIPERNYNNSSRSGRVELDMSNGTNGAYLEEAYERSRTPYGLLITSFVLTVLSYIFFALTSPIT